MCTALLDMTLAELFRSPFVRIPFLGFAIFATVATTATPGWSRESATPPERLELAKGATAERQFTYEASQAPVDLEILLDAFSATSGKLRVVAEKGCVVDRTYGQLEPFRWYLLDGDGKSQGGYSAREFITKTTCPEGKGSVTVRIENVGAEPIVFSSTVKASVGGGPGEEDAPDGAFVTLRRVP